MDLLKKYGSKELARMTYRMLQDKRNKKRMDVEYFIADSRRRAYSQLNDSRKKMKVW